MKELNKKMDLEKDKILIKKKLLRTRLYYVYISNKQIKQKLRYGTIMTAL
jgi:hypothetical protein